MSFGLLHMFEKHIYLVLFWFESERIGAYLSAIQSSWLSQRYIHICFFSLSTQAWQYYAALVQ